MRFSKSMLAGAFASLVLAFVVTFPAGCGSSTASNVTISGKLQTSARQTMADSRVSAVTPLAGYQLYCLTFEEPAATATATAGTDGTVSITFAAKDKAFGCFVRNTAGTVIAALFFASTADNATGQALALGGNTDFGNISVDEPNGTATVTVAGPLAKTTSVGACPIGNWKGTVGTNSECPTPPTVTGSIGILKNSDGTYTINQTFNPTQKGGSGTNTSSNCGLHSFPAIASSISYTDKVLKYSFSGGSDVVQITATANAACDQLSVVVTQTQCTGCGSGANPVTDCQQTINMAKDKTCPSNAFVFTRQ